MSSMVRPGGKLVTYGPYAQDGVLTPESNQQVEIWRNTPETIRFYPVPVRFESTFTWPLVGDSRHHRTEGGWGGPGAQSGSGLKRPQTITFDISFPMNPPKIIPNYQVVEMPANNKILVFVKRASGRLWSRVQTALIASVPCCAFILQDLFVSNL